MKITILEDTTRAPLEAIGRYAGECWGSDTVDKKKNIKRGKECLANNHGRTLEFPQIFLKIEGASARVIRELYTHIGGMPTRLQASTRYINYEDFDYILPKSIERDSAARAAYEEALEGIKKAAKILKEAGIPREDIANILPLGMETTVVIRTNLRNLIDMSRQRLCTRAYWEFRLLMDVLIEELQKYDEDYKFITENYFGPKCDFLGYCPEKKSCGRWPTGVTSKRAPKKIELTIPPVEKTPKANLEDLAEKASAGVSRIVGDIKKVDVKKVLKESEAKVSEAVNKTIENIKKDKPIKPYIGKITPKKELPKFEFKRPRIEITEKDLEEIQEVIIF